VKGYQEIDKVIATIEAQQNLVVAV